MNTLFKIFDMKETAAPTNWVILTRIIPKSEHFLLSAGDLFFCGAEVSSSYPRTSWSQGWAHEGHTVSSWYMLHIIASCISVVVIIWTCHRLCLFGPDFSAGGISPTGWSGCLAPSQRKLRKLRKLPKDMVIFIKTNSNDYPDESKSWTF